MPIKINKKKKNQDDELTVQFWSELGCLLCLSLGPPDWSPHDSPSIVPALPIGHSWVWKREQTHMRLPACAGIEFATVTWINTIPVTEPEPRGRGPSSYWARKVDTGGQLVKPSCDHSSQHLPATEYQEYNGTRWVYYPFQWGWAQPGKPWGVLVKEYQKGVVIGFELVLVIWGYRALLGINAPRKQR